MDVTEKFEKLKHYLRFVLRANKLAVEEFHWKQLLQRAHPSSWRDGRGREQLTTGCLERCPKGGVSEEPSHLIES